MGIPFRRKPGNHIFWPYDLDLWPTTLTYNPSLAKFKVYPHTKNQDHRSNGLAVRVLTDTQTHRHTHTHRSDSMTSTADAGGKKKLWSNRFTQTAYPIINVSNKRPLNLLHHAIMAVPLSTTQAFWLVYKYWSCHFVIFISRTQPFVYA